MMSNSGSIAAVAALVLRLSSCGSGTDGPSTGTCGSTGPAEGSQLEEFVTSAFCALRNACCEKYVGAFTDQRCDYNLVCRIQQKWAGR